MDLSSFIFVRLFSDCLKENWILFVSEVAFIDPLYFSVLPTFIATPFDQMSTSPTFKKIYLNLQIIPTKD